MSQPHNSTRADYGSDSRYRQDDAAELGERSAGSEIAGSIAKVLQAANHGRIIGFVLGELAGQPLSERGALAVADIFETDARAVFVALPGEFPRELKFLVYALVFN